MQKFLTESLAGEDSSQQQAAAAATAVAAAATAAEAAAAAGGTWTHTQICDDVELEAGAGQADRHLPSMREMT